MGRGLVPPRFKALRTGAAAENSVLFYLALRKTGVPAELHVYEKGEHGFGLAPNDPVLSTWPRLCIEWMRSRNGH
jgi:acetyl esterase/lipase